jgi:hypothetical protein
MLIVVGLLSLMVGITFPSVTAGIDSLRINAASDSIVSFLNGAMNRCERRQEVMEIEISLAKNTLAMRSARPGFEKVLEMPKNVTIRRVLPEIPADPDAPRRVMFFPGGTVPRVGIELVNSRGSRRLVRVDPVTGAPEIQRDGEYE